MRKSRNQQRRPDRGDKRKGATLIEFSLSFLLFVILMVGLVEASRLVWAYTTLAHAARRGARFVMVHNGRNPATDAQVETVVKAYTVGLNDNSVTVSSNYDDASRSGGTNAQVAVTYPFQFIASPLIFHDGNLTLTATSTTSLAE